MRMAHTTCSVRGDSNRGWRHAAYRSLRPWGLSPCLHYLLAHCTSEIDLAVTYKCNWSQGDEEEMWQMWGNRFLIYMMWRWWWGYLDADSRTLRWLEGGQLEGHSCVFLCSLKKADYYDPKEERKARLALWLSQAKTVLHINGLPWATISRKRSRTFYEGHHASYYNVP